MPRACRVRQLFNQDVDSVRDSMMQTPTKSVTDTKVPWHAWTRWAGYRSAGSIRGRVLAIALIPCIALVITGATVVVGLASEARSASRWSDFLNEQLDPIVTLVQAMQGERATSLAALNGDPQAVGALPTRRAEMDAAEAGVARLAPRMAELNPDGVAQSNPLFAQFSARIPAIRQAVDTRRANATEVNAFYTGLSDVIALGLTGLARSTPDSSTAVEEGTAADLMRMADLHSAAVGVAAAALPEGPLGSSERRLVTQLAGAYRDQLRGLQPRLTESGRARVQSLMSSATWSAVTRAEDELAEQGTLPMPFADWQSDESSVGAELMGLFKDHAVFANRSAADAAGKSLTRSIVAAAGVAGISICAFLLALLLANRLVRRLRSLRSRSLELANETLPSIVRRLRDGEQVDIEAETAMLDNRADELGQVAEAFATAQRTAMAAAAGEARTRDGFNRVFLDIAYRSQVIVRRQLEVLDIAEEKQGDPEHLELLFQLDHLATRARRNAENLLILGGAPPGRRWREPVSLEEIVRSAASETQDFARVNAIRLPEVRVSGSAVADVIHLLAELIDNATLFSPPQASVSVSGNHVGRGVVVEVEDQGLGIRFEERERLNDTLREPPGFEGMALAGQRHLGLFVVGQLARRHSITVSLHESAYGGVKAIVLIPALLLDAAADDDRTDPGGAAVPSIRRRPDRQMPSVRDPIPRHSAGENLRLPPWPGDSAAEPAPAARSIGEFRGGSGPIPSAAARPVSRGRAPLPRRERQTHLAPQLRLDDSMPGDQAHAMVDDRRNAEQVRHSMASFQRGTRQARALAPHTNQ